MKLQLEKELLKLNMDVTTKEEALLTMIDMLFQNGNIEDREVFKQAVYEREAIGETGMENFIAIPHGKSRTVTYPSVAIARNKKTIYWENIDGSNQARLIFLLAVPDDTDQSTEHLRLLSTLARALAYKEVQDKMLQIENEEDLYDYFSKILNGEKE